MCGRFFIRPEVEEILAFLHAVPEDGLTAAHPRWNVAPTQDVLAAFTDELGARRLGAFRWGLVPSWWKDPKLPTFLNARADTAAVKPAFRSAFARRRALVPASGFYEWRTGAAKADPKTPYAIGRPDGGLLAMAGLWEIWHGPSGPVRSLTVLTCHPSPEVAPIHDRMPVIVPPSRWSAWLDPRTGAEALATLLCPAEGLVPREVGRGVNDARNGAGDWFVEPA